MRSALVAAVLISGFLASSLIGLTSPLSPPRFGERSSLFPMREGDQGVRLAAAASHPSDTCAGASITTYRRDNSGLLSDRVQAIAVDSTGRVWFGTEGGVSALDGSTWMTYTLESTSRRGDPVARVTSPVVQGTWLVPSDFSDHSQADAVLGSGYVLFGNDPTFYRYLGLFADTVWMAIGIDPTLRQGLAVGSPIYAVDVGLVANAINAIAVSPPNPPIGDGDIWFGTEWGASRLRGSSWRAYSRYQGLAEGWVTAVVSDRAGNVWFGTQGRGLSVLHPDSSWQSFGQAQGLSDEHITALAVDRDNSLWVGTLWAGVQVTNTTWLTWTLYDTVTSGLASDHVKTLTIGPDGRKWIGTLQNGVSVFDGQSWTTFTAIDGLADNQITALAVDNQNRAWIGTLNGLSRLEDQGTPGKSDDVWITCTRLQGLASNEILGIAFEGDHKVWVGTDRGANLLDLEPGPAATSTSTPTLTFTPVQTGTPTPTPTSTPTGTSTQMPIPTATVTPAHATTTTPTTTPTATATSATLPTLTSTPMVTQAPPTATPALGSGLNVYLPLIIQGASETSP